jgi:hypothetical protein
MDTLPQTRRNSLKVAEQRRDQRFDVMWMATLRAAHGFYDCLVLNISRGGAKIALSEQCSLTIDDPVTLILESFGPLRAVIVWDRAGFAGIRFSDPADKIAESLGDIVT